MKTIATSILIFAVTFVYGQEILRFRITTPKAIYGPIVKTMTIDHSGKLDFDFYRKHFFTPYHYPQQMVDPNHKNDTVTISNDTAKIGNFINNWSYTITYDAQSRVTSYKYSPCMRCSQLPYHYYFFYNQLGQVIKIKNNLNEDNTIEFKYDTNGNIVSLKEYKFSDLRQEIELKSKK
ncbi:hypothetical protein [Pedobacter agri]|uniref:hypothetical protein n=1 Tax=Pedobacter agri TaxID=454586 RepID=UPI00292EE9B6|nr:hypothetical protein [Pedobacter agri]